MIFTAFGGVFTLALGYYLVGTMNNEDTGELFKVVSAKTMRHSQENIRRRKLVVTMEEMKKLDPTFVLPHISAAGEADI